MPNHIAKQSPSHLVMFSIVQEVNLIDVFIQLAQSIPDSDFSSEVQLKMAHKCFNNQAFVYVGFKSSQAKAINLMR